MVHKIVLCFLFVSRWNYDWERLLLVWLADFFCLLFCVCVVGVGG